MDFVERVQRQQARLFDGVLPAFIERYLSGDGHELRFQLKEAIARRDLSALDGRPPPGDAALERAHFVRVNCPLETWAQPPEGEAWRAEYLQGSTESAGIVTWSRHVVVCASGFTANGWADERLDDELFWALFAAYVRYFDAVAGDAASATRADARRRDARARLRRVMKWTVGAAVVATCGVVAAVSAPSGDEPRQRPPLATSARANAEQQRQRDAREAAALSRRIHDAADRQLAPREAMEAVGGAPLLPEHPLVAGVDLGEDPDVPGAQAAPVDAVLTLLWLRPGALSPLRFTGLAWDARGAVHVVDVSNANRLKPVATTAP